MEKYLVMGCQPYDFEQNGQRITGCTIFYLPNAKDPNSRMYGTKAIEIKAPLEQAQNFSEGEGIYELGFSIVPGTRGTPKMVLTTAKFIKKIDFNKLLVS